MGRRGVGLGWGRGRGRGLKRWVAVHGESIRVLLEYGMMTQSTSEILVIYGPKPFHRAFMNAKTHHHSSPLPMPGTPNENATTPEYAERSQDLPQLTLLRRGQTRRELHRHLHNHIPPLGRLLRIWHPQMRERFLEPRLRWPAARDW